MTIIADPAPRLGGITYEMEIITPDVARQYLTLNINNNRTKKKAKISGYARDMKSGNWLFTGEAIKFDTDGNLVDGQNRLEAVILADSPAAFLVVRGIAQEAVALLDSGTARTGYDALVISGFERATAKDVAAAARFHYAYFTGDIPHAMSGNGNGSMLTKRELIEYISRNPQLEKAARFSKSMRKYLDLPIGPIAVAYDVFTRIDIDAAVDFFNRIKDGISTGHGDPFLTLTRRIAQDRQYGSTRIIPSTALFYLFRTWNAYRANESLSKFQIGSRASGFTPIPTPK